jgi:hypothetical protein
LDDYATWFAQKNMEASIARTRERFREKDAAEVKACTAIEEPSPALVPAPREDPGDPPFLTRPQRATAEGSAGQHQRSPFPKRDRAPHHVQDPERPARPVRPAPSRTRPASPDPAWPPGVPPPLRTRTPPLQSPLVAARLDQAPIRLGNRRVARPNPHLFVAARLNRNPTRPESQRRGASPAHPEPAPRPCRATTKPPPPPGCCGRPRPATAHPASRRPRWR